MTNEINNNLINKFIITPEKMIKPITGSESTENASNFQLPNETQDEQVVLESFKLEDLNTTMAVGEEGGGYNPVRPFLPIDEEIKPENPSEYTSMAMGEEGGNSPIKEPSTHTTMAVGEEGGGYNPARPFLPIDEEIKPENPSEYTSMAMGEEGGNSLPEKPSKPIEEGTPTKPRVKENKKDSQPVAVNLFNYKQILGNYLKENNLSIDVFYKNAGLSGFPSRTEIINALQKVIQ